jgi:hypothetical protein
MKEPHEQGVANQFGPESCADLREGVGEAFDRGKSRPAIELVKSSLCACRPCLIRGKATRRRRISRADGRRHGV